MKFFCCLIGTFVILSTATGGFAATTTAAPAPAASAAPPAAPAPLPAAQAVCHLKFDDYINELTSALKLSDDEKKDVISFYQADGGQLKTILNSDGISPLEQDRQVSDLRDARNAKIEALLGSPERTAAFLKVEAQYRVAVVELAMDGGLVPPAPADSSAAPAPAATPAPAAAPAAPVSAKTPPPE